MAGVRAGVPDTATLRQVASRQAGLAQEAYERWDFSAAAEAVLAISGRGNAYMEEQAPWSTLKKVLVQGTHACFLLSH